MLLLSVTRNMVLMLCDFQYVKICSLSFRVYIPNLCPLQALSNFHSPSTQLCLHSTEHRTLPIADPASYKWQSGIIYLLILSLADRKLISYISYSTWWLHPFLMYMNEIHIKGKQGIDQFSLQYWPSICL